LEDIAPPEANILSILSQNHCFCKGKLNNVKISACGEPKPRKHYKYPRQQISFANPHDVLELKTVQILVVEKLVTWSEDVAFCNVGRAQTLNSGPPSLRSEKGEEGGPELKEFH